MNPIRAKYCSGCGRTKPAEREFFHYDNSTQDGFKDRCIKCVAHYMKYDYVPSNQKSRLTTAEIAEIDTRIDTLTLPGRLAKAAKKARYASDGIVLDGVKLNIKIKVCSECQVQKPATSYFFRKNTQYKDGFYSKCKLCSK